MQQRDMLALILALTGALMLASGAVADDATAAAPVASDSSSGQKITVRSLDDPANPYRGEYGALDRWAWGHSSAGSTALATAPFLQSAGLPQLGTARTISATVEVDSAGWPIPASQSWSDARYATFHSDPEPGQSVRDFFEQQRAMFEPDWVAPPRPQTPVAPDFYFTAQGMAPAEVADAWDLLTQGHAARSCPPLPAWLGENPPSQTVALPDGTFFCYGGLGLRYGELPGRPAVLFGLTYGDPWYRYGADGQLLSQQPSPVGMHNWHESLLPELTARVRQDTAGQFGSAGLTMLHGILFETPPNYLHIDPPGPPSGPTELLAAYTWDGQPLDLDAPCPVTPATTCTVLDPARVALLFQVQLRLGLTRGDTQSPYAGTPRGPVVAAGPMPRPIPLLAFGMADGNEVVVRALDDPANPFRGQYSKWDELLYAHAGESNPAMNAAVTSQMNDYLEARNAAVKAGQPLPPYPMVGYTEPKGSLWRTLDGVVDADGWLVPQAELLRRNRALGNAPRPRYFTLQAQLQLSAAEYQQYEDDYKSIN